MNDPISINRELSGKDPDPQPPAKIRRPRKERPTRTQPGFKKTRQPQASERASMLAQDWYDAGESRGFSFPYDVNYLALALQRKIENDPEMKPFLLKGKSNQVNRWAAKMVERWWAEYADGTITASNAKDQFLGEDWDDLRYYARSCLEAAYLKEHGRRVPAPAYPGQQEYQDRLREIREREGIRTYLKTLDDPTDVREIALDKEGRSRLRSFVDKRRKK